MARSGATAMNITPDDIWVVIPAYNEEVNIGLVLDKTRGFAKKILVVDDGSSDRTAEIAKKSRVSVLRLGQNRGKGTALRAGCDYAVKSGAKMIAVMDADQQHDPADIPKLIKTLREQGADVVYTWRLPSKRMPITFAFGNWILNALTAWLFGVDLRDTQCGFRAFTADAYRKARWKARGYAVESEMIVNGSLAKLRWAEMPIPTIYHDTYKGTTPLDGIKIALHLIWWKMTKRSRDA